MSRFLPVILGADVGAYSLARQFHEAYGIRSLLVSAYRPLAVQDSGIVDLHHFAQAGQEGPLVAELVRLGKTLRDKDPSRRLILLANTEWRVQTIVTHSDELAPYYLLPFPSAAELAAAGDKEVFERRAAAAGLKVPISFYQDFSEADSEDWSPAPLPRGLTFPVVAKPAASAGYEQLVFEGRKKVYRIDSLNELDQLWATLRKAGFRDRFIVQQLIEGDDTSMYIAVAYVDSHGETSFVCTGQLLLGEHHPAFLGNPLTIITRPVPEVADGVRTFLASIDYHGFSNFDIKRDARTGEFYFLEQNPRMGRSSLFCLGQGVNPMEVMVDDLLEDDRTRPVVSSRPSLFTLVPPVVVRSWTRSPRLRQQLRTLVRHGRVISPLRYEADSSRARRLRVTAFEVNHLRKLIRYYPRPTRTGF